MDKSKVRLAYDASNNVMFMEMKGLRLETRADIDAYFNVLVDFWRKNCHGQKVFNVVCYDDFTVNIRENAYYAERMSAAAVMCTETVVRYGGDSLQRSAARLRSVKVHMPSNLYESRQQALEVVRQIRSGELRIATA